MKLNTAILLPSIFIIFLVTSCQEEDIVNDQEWLIPRDAIKKGADKDAIAALDNPSFVSPTSGQAVALTKDEMVLGIKSGDNIKAYPYKMLNWHEIINDEIGNRFIAVTYSSLTGTGIAWNRKIQGNIQLFGVSGRLYNANLIAFDRETNSNWSQMLRKSVNGVLADTPLETVQMVATNWATWQRMYPNTQVLSANTAFPRNYDYYPYGNYRSEQEQLRFPATPLDKRLPLKSRVHGVIINQQAKAYPHTIFGDSIKVIHDNFQNESIVVAGSGREDMIVAFKNQLEDGTDITLNAVQNELPIIMEDSLGNKWDIFGKAIEGPQQGEELQQITNYDGYWFAWGAFFPELEIYGKK